MYEVFDYLGFVGIMIGTFITVTPQLLCTKNLIRER